MIKKLHLVTKDFSEILKKSKEVSIEDILKKICVSPPYFAFKKIYQYEDVLIAPIDPEQDTGNEIGEISVTEAGRHLAILGSCLFAIEEKEKCYYLAYEANMKSLLDEDSTFQNNSSDQMFVAVMKSEGIEDKVGSYGIIFKNSSVIFDLDVKYQKMKERVFKKIFKNFAVDYQPKDASPYRSFPIDLKNLKISEESLLSILPKIGVENCSGHFDVSHAASCNISLYSV